MMVGTLGIVLALWVSVTADADSATGYATRSAQSWPPLSSIQRAGTRASQDPVPQPAPAPKEQEPAPKPEEIKNPTVEGHVKLRDGKPAAGATVIAKGPAGTVANATADASGKFRFTGPAGTYSLEIHAGEKSRTFKAEIAAGKLTPAEFTVE